MLKSISIITVKLFVICVLLISGIFCVRAQDLKAEDIAAKNLDSIGTKEKREAVKTRMAVGISEFESKLPSRKTGGKVIIVSETNNLFFVSSFNTENYPYEKIGYFAGKVNVPFVTQGTRSPLGVFLNDHNKSLSNGLFTGSISSMWNLQSGKGKLDAARTKKINGRRAYAINYYENGSSASFSIKLYFDAENFRHIRTEYRDVITAKEAAFGTLGKESGVETVLTEDFADYKEADGLTLPYTYKIYYMTASNNGTFEYNWTFRIAEYRLNQKLAPDFFQF